MKRATLIVFSLFSATMFSGCIGQGEKAAQLSTVAKNWCMNIRASEVIPVYPLTEDVQVGDVYIVQRPVEDEVQIYSESGFLPLGHHLDRLTSLDFTEFYSGQYGINKNNQPPAFWRNPTTKPAGGTNTGVSNLSPTTQPSTNWVVAPRAAFPAYSFSINRGSTLDVGLPIHGIPVALGLLGSDSATATVSLDDAYVYGLPEAELEEKLKDWAGKEDNKKLLRQYEPYYKVQPGALIAFPFNLWPFHANAQSYRLQYTYIRVVTRVYFVQNVSVDVNDMTQAGGKFRAGVITPSQLLAQPGGSKAYSDLLTAINGSGSTTQPTQAAGVPDVGGSLKLASAIGNSVSLNEKFSRPLSIGYLAFDFPIGQDGVLGITPISTTLRISRGAPVDVSKEVQAWASRNPEAQTQLAQWVGQDSNRDWLDHNGFNRFARLPIDVHALLKFLLWPGLFDSSFPTPELTQLYERIADEIVERPAGAALYHSPTTHQLNLIDTRKSMVKQGKEAKPK